MIPKNITSRKAKIAYFIFKNLYLFDLGKNRVLGRPLTFLPELAAVYLLLKFAGIYDPPKSVIIIVIIAGCFVSWTVGLIYYKLQLDQIENLILNERNPLMREVHEEVVKNGKHI